MKTMMFNPYTGLPRDPRDIASDPAGLLMLDPDEPVLAARRAPKPAHDVCTRLGRTWERHSWVRVGGGTARCQHCGDERPI